MKVFIAILLILSIPFLAHAETIQLKSGQIIDGSIKERTNDYVKVKMRGVGLEGIEMTYWMDEIKSIDGQNINAPAEIETFHPRHSFVPGNNVVVPSSVESTNDGNINTPAKAETSRVAHSFVPQNNGVPQASDVFEKISKSVVYITSDNASLGSGFIVSSDGAIATNIHVVENAIAVKVRLYDGQEFPVTGVLWKDQEKDLAVLKIDVDNLPALHFGDMQSLRVGDRVYCVGNPLGLDFSFSDGMISALREVQGTNYIQFTAPVSPGNSGGPLLNIRGEMIGVVTMQMVSGQNLNFAVKGDQLPQTLTGLPLSPLTELRGKEGSPLEILKALYQSQYPGLDLGDLSSSFLVAQAFSSLQNNRTEDVKAYVDVLFSMYGEFAGVMQNSLTEYPWETKEKIFSYWALNDVGTGLFILGEVYRQEGKLAEAVDVYQKVINEYYFAQCWDLEGWFWKPAEAANQRLEEIQNSKNKPFWQKMIGG